MLHSRLPLSRRIRLSAAALTVCALSACAGTSYTGPVEVTRFVAENPGVLGSGRIATEIATDEEFKLETAVYEQAVTTELLALGYDTAGGASAGQKAFVRVERGAFAAATNDRNPVDVGVGGRTGSFGSGVGVGVGINLGGSGSKPREVTQLAVRIVDQASGDTLWEGRAEITTSTDSPYAAPGANASTLAAALFQSFP
ncbi:MAG: DUF4136 domain-containing protein, partial [Pseudomonadota bacterium]